MVREFSRIFGVCAITGLLTVVFATTAAAQPPGPEPTRRGHQCSLKTIVGSWVYATGVGEFRDENGNLTGRGTSMGTWNVDKDGNMTGEFDATLSFLGYRNLVLEDVEYWGPVTVYPDCTGTYSFETEHGSTRTESIVISGNGSEIRGMSHTEGVLWTFTLKRVRGDDDD